MKFIVLKLRKEQPEIRQFCFNLRNFFMNKGIHDIGLTVAMEEFFYLSKIMFNLRSESDPARLRPVLSGRFRG